MRVIGTENEFSCYVELADRPMPLEGMSQKTDRELRYEAEGNIMAEFFKGRHIPVPGLYSNSKRFLTNGACFYMDVGNHPEYASQEAFGALGATICQATGVRFMQELLAGTRGDPNSAINNAAISRATVLNRVANDHETWGHHINMQAKRKLELSPESLAPLLLTMLGGISLFGAGINYRSGNYFHFQKGQQIVDYISKTTTQIKPLINVRDEPHADSSRWRRLHIVGNDILHAPWATWLRFATYDLAIALAEQRPDLSEKLADSLPGNAKLAVSSLSRDPYSGEGVVVGGERLQARDLMEIVYEQIDAAIRRGDISVDNAQFERQLAMDEWAYAIDRLGNKPSDLDDLVQSRYRPYVHQAADIKLSATQNNPNAHYAIDVMLDDVEQSTALARGFQNRLAISGWNRLGAVFGMDPASFPAQVEHYLYSPYPGRSSARAEAIRTRPEFADMQVDWHRWRIESSVYKTKNADSDKVISYELTPETADVIMRGI